MSYFIDEDRGFGVYTSPFSGEDALRTWLYYAGSGEARASTNVEFYYGDSEVNTSLKDWGFSTTLYEKSVVGKNICIYRHPFERFISTYYTLRVLNGFFGDTLDNFLKNYDSFMEDEKLRYIFSTQTSHLGSKDSYSSTITYRNFNSLKGFLETQWEAALPSLNLPHTGAPCRFTGSICEFDLTTPQKKILSKIYREDFENGWDQ